MVPRPGRGALSMLYSMNVQMDIDGRFIRRKPLGDPMAKNVPGEQL